MRSKNASLDLVDGRRVYTLRQRWRTWYKDGDAKQVEIARCGFPLVPDFAGTAHMYCGTSLDACIGDLLEWHERQQRDEQCAVTLSSRVSDRLTNFCSHNLLARIYFEWVLQGDQIICYRLCKESWHSNRQALQQWDADTKQDEEQAERRKVGCYTRFLAGKSC